MMRGSRDFATVSAYDQFLRKLFAKMNAARRERFAEELSQLQPLPHGRLDTMRRERVRVSPRSLIHVHRNTYSVHSRLIGEIVEARIKSDRGSLVRRSQSGRVADTARPQQTPHRLPPHH
jgi:hypothetical protein